MGYFDDIRPRRWIGPGLYTPDMEDVVPKAGGLLGGFDYRRPEGNIQNFAATTPLGTSMPPVLPSVAEAMKKAEALRGLPEEQAGQLVEQIDKLPQQLTSRLNGAELRWYKSDPNVMAYLDSIAEPESRGDYYRLGAGGHFSDESQHPGRGLRNKAGKLNTASGRYQITAETFDEICRATGQCDFSPETQDLMAIYLLKQRGALDHIMAGDIDNALARSYKRWNALPAGPIAKPDRPDENYDPRQPHWTVDQFKSYFNKRRNLHTGGP